ncbi:MFS transporter [Novosphingobium sediminis]|uniref:MFS transporter n=1 Tax=Novosphingobium sediminis TaxID=707214 RepID=A0A512ANI7_9SPHN|nr:MFS transporter [Novosphingobium sediminis]GEO01273.1 MFS transporter [Novosphingobium sediminis]
MGEHRRYRQFVLAVITFGGMLNIADRLILSIMLEDIKHAFTLSDTEIGLITGFAFTLLYVVCGLPLAWLADRMSRPLIIAVSIATWSLMTALCGMATGFWTFFLARMGVGIGESGSGPAGTSLLTQTFKGHELGRAMGIYFLGPTLGTAAGLILGGVLAHTVGWRMTFLLLGIPGILFALFVFMTVKEPGGRPIPPKVSLAEGLTAWFTGIRALLANRVFLAASAAFGCMIVTGYGFATWLAAIMLRGFHVSTADVGFYLGLAFVLGGIPGPLLGGYLTDWLVRRDARWRAWLPAIATLGCLPIYLAALLSTNFWTFLGLFSCGYLVFLTAQAPTVSLIQLAVRPDERAMAMAVAMIFNNLIGQALGLFLIGLASTSLTPTFGPQALTWALIGVSAAFAVPAAFFYLYAAGGMAKGPLKMMNSPDSSQA